MRSMKIDLCLCIDGTGGMTCFCEALRNGAPRLRESIAAAMAKRQYALESLRVRVIAFRDYACDGDGAMVESEFFDLGDPLQQKAFETFVNGIEAAGGGDCPENALEAIVQAIRSDWRSDGDRSCRQVIMLVTDAPALPLRDPRRAEAPLYPQDMPEDLPELYDLFANGDAERAPAYSPKRARMLVVAPEEGEAWRTLKLWKHIWFVPVVRSNGCLDVEFNDLLAVFAGTI